MSPVVHVRLAEQPKDSAEAEAALQQVVNTALRKSGVLLSVNRMSKLDAVKGGPSIRWEGSPAVALSACGGCAGLHPAACLRWLDRPNQLSSLLHLVSVQLCVPELRMTVHPGAIVSRRFARLPCRMVVTAAHTERHISKAVAALDAAVQSRTVGRGAQA